MAEESKDRLEMWGMLAESGDEWEYVPDPEVLAANAFFTSLMGTVNKMVDIKTELSMTEEERADVMSQLKRNMASLVWVTPLYENFLKTDLSGSKEG